LRKQNKDSINMRTFEIPAAGGFMFHEVSSEAKHFFTPNEEVVYFSNVQELVNLCQVYLNDEVSRKKLIANSTKKINQGIYSYQKIIESSLNEI
jgi:spore maturation protein CgeB